jgi:hypothetical protein
MVADSNLVKKMIATGREIYLAEPDDPNLGPFRWLPGTWKNTEELAGHGFNMIALPYVGTDAEPSENGYRLLMNQYNESLIFDFADVGAPNRGVAIVVDPNDPTKRTTVQADQIAASLSYTQVVTQIAFEDSFLVSASGLPTSTLSKTNISEKFNDKGIHHEPGLWIWNTDQPIFQEEREDRRELNIARTGSIPHGNGFIAVGHGREFEKEGPFELIPRINGVVVGGGTDPDEPPLEPIINRQTKLIDIDYFAPYRHFHQNPFKGKKIIPGFIGFEPVHSTTLLDHARDTILKKIGSIKNVTRLQVDSTIDHAAINRVANPSIGNTPFITRQADTTAMIATFIIYEIEDSKSGEMRYFLQYAQNVIMDFIGRPDGHPGRARWPHISINTLERVAKATPHAIAESLPSR